MALVFDGYDLVIYGAVLPTLFKDPSQLGPAELLSSREPWAATRSSAS